MEPSVCKKMGSMMAQCMRTIMTSRSRVARYLSSLAVGSGILILTKVAATVSWIAPAVRAVSQNCVGHEVGQAVSSRL